jgi:hypothetical protein
MVFFVYLDPAVIHAASAAGTFGWESLTAMLRGFVQNCVVLDFDDYRWAPSIRTELAAAEEVFDRSLVKKLLVQIEKRNRIMPQFQDDYSGRPELDLVTEQAGKAELDCIVAEAPGSLPSDSRARITRLACYQSSGFEQERSEIAAHGREYSGGELGEADFLRSNFSKLLRFARRIEVCDAMLGPKFSDNFKHGLKLFLDLVSRESTSESGCEIVLHSEESERAGFLGDTVQEHQQRLPKTIKLRVQFYCARSLPHERFLWTDQFALEIGRGMDFLDPKTRKNRDVSLNLKDQEQVARKVEQFSQFRVGGGCRVTKTESSL